MVLEKVAVPPDPRVVLAGMKTVTGCVMLNFPKPVVELAVKNGTPPVVTVNGYVIVPGVGFVQVPLELPSTAALVHDTVVGAPWIVVALVGSLFVPAVN